MKAEIENIIKEIKEIKLEMASMQEDIRKLKEADFSTGVILDGVPEYAVEYIGKTKKEGE